MIKQCSNKEKYRKISYAVLIVTIIAITYLAETFTQNDTYMIVTDLKLDCKCHTEPHIEYARQQENQGMNYTIKKISTTTQKCICENRS